MASQLAPLREVEKLSSNVIRILGGNPGKVLDPILICKFALTVFSLLYKVLVAIF
jgi:hypothetical protein